MTHATDIKPTRPLDICPVRDRCHKYTGYRCGFEQARTVRGCPKRKRLEGEG
jgi:hypothetical protein